MRGRKTWVVLLILTLLLIGCSDLGELQKNMIENNQRVEKSLTNYGQVLSSGVGVEDEVIDYLKSGGKSELSILTELLLKQENTENIKNRFNEISERIINYKEDMLRLFEESDDEEQEIIGEVPTIEEVIDNSITTYYFLDDTKGIVEQMFLIELPNGYTDRMTLVWVGGEYIDFKEVRDN